MKNCSNGNYQKKFAKSERKDFEWKNKDDSARSAKTKDWANNFLVNLASQYTLESITSFSASGNQPELFERTPDWHSNSDHIALHNLHISKHDNRFRKSWGNFINIFDEQGEQKCVISRRELANYIQLTNYSQSRSHFVFYAALFAGNYPKPLYNSATSSWRMRYNFFAGNLFSATSGFYKISNFGDEQLSSNGSDLLIHIGELHIYFNVEKNSLNPIYQNLCFFFDNNFSNFSPKKLKQDKHLKKISEMFSSSVVVSFQAQLKECANQLRNELMCRNFIEQLFFPMPSSTLINCDKATQIYFTYRQIDLKAAIEISNKTKLTNFLHRIKNV